MKHNHILKTNELAKLPAAQSTPLATTRSFIASRFGLLGCAALLLVAASSAFAQTTNVTDVYNVLVPTVPATVNSVALTSRTADKARLTIPVNQTSSVATTVRVRVAGGQTTLTSSITNIVGLDYFITNYFDLNPAVATLAATGVPSTGGGATVVFGNPTITNTNAGGADFDVPVTLNYTNVTSGDYDMAVVASGANSWRYPLPVKAGYQWSAGGTATDVSFGSTANWLGGVVPGANDIVILSDAGAVSANNVPTVGITVDRTISSLSDIHTGDNYTHLSIAAGTTLSILGDGGLRQLVDLIETAQRSRIRASGAGTLIVSNANAEFNMFTTRQNNSHDSSDFSALNTMILDVKKIAFNDIAAYPNHGTNGAATYPRSMVYDMDWALTNILRATLTDANNWTNEARDYGMVINRSSIQTGNDGGMHFGLWNELYMDSILFGGYSQMENPEVDFRAASGSYLKLRNTDKVSRVSNLTIADAADYFGTLSRSGGTKIDVSFTKGTVDALIDTLMIGRDPRLTANGAANGKLFMGAGTFDVNNAYLGYQTDNIGGTESGSATGTVEVNNGGIFRVNNTLVLGYTVTNLLTVVSGGGTLNVNAGSTAEINTLTVGGPANATTLNNISVNGGTLVVSNSAGSASARINILTMNNSTLTIVANAVSPSVHVKTLVTGGSGNTLKVAGVTGVGSYPATVALISYVDPAAPNFQLELPAGLYGYVVNNTANSTIDAVISTTPPASLVWAGGDGKWDVATANWQGAAVFVNGDGVTFNDSASGTTAVTVVGTVTLGSGGVLVTNDTKAYSLIGGTISGSATMTKEGANTLTVDATSELALAVNAGTVNGSGSLGSTTVGTNGTLNYTGTIAKLTTAGTVSSSGTINLSATVTGGTFVNSGIINGIISLSGASTTTFQPGSTVTTPGISTATTGSTLVHNGQMNLGTANANSRFTVTGNLTGSGTITDTTGDANANNGRLEISAGGVFTPGGSNTIGDFTVEGRFDLNAGSPDGTMIIDVDLNHAQTNDVVKPDKWSNLRGALVMNNIGSVPFAAGQSFQICSINFGQPNKPETAFDLANKITPAAPGVGLQWDLGNLRTNGIIAVIAAPLTPPTMTNSVVGGTNLTLSWPASHIGYQLQVQTNTLAVGISNSWFPIAGSETVTTWSAAVDPANPTVFYRLSNQ